MTILKNTSTITNFGKSFDCNIRIFIDLPHLALPIKDSFKGLDFSERFQSTINYISPLLNNIDCTQFELNIELSGKETKGNALFLTAIPENGNRFVVFGVYTDIHICYSNLITDNAFLAEIKENFRTKIFPYSSSLPAYPKIIVYKGKTSFHLPYHSLENRERQDFLLTCNEDNEIKLVFPVSLETSFLSIPSCDTETLQMVSTKISSASSLPSKEKNKIIEPMYKSISPVTKLIQSLGYN